MSNHAAAVAETLDNDHPEDDVWIAHRWIAELSKRTEHRVLPKRLAEPINRLIAVTSDLHRSHTMVPQEVRPSDA